MTRTGFIASIASAAVVAATPALAAPGGNGGGHGGGHGGQVNVGAGANIGATVRDTARVNSQGSVNANARAMERANANSAIDSNADVVTGSRLKAEDSNRVRSSVRGDNRVATAGMLGTPLNSQLTGVTNGMAVVDTGGATVGTVTGISTKGNGSIRDVQVTLTNGQIITLAPNSLNLSGGILTTNSLTTNVNSQGAAHASVNGLVHASPNSALARAGVTSLTGLATGLTVNNSGGTSVGTVSRIVTNRTGGVVAIDVALTGGGTATIPATSLSMNGSTVVTSSTNF